MSDQAGDAWALRAVRNQSVFRAINDELKARGRSGDVGSLTIACECADPECVGTLEIPSERYAEVREEATHFIVLSGHVYPEVEHVVAQDDGFMVVEKIGEAGRIAVAANGGGDDSGPADRPWRRARRILSRINGLSR